MELQLDTTIGGAAIGAAVKGISGLSRSLSMIGESVAGIGNLAKAEGRLGRTLADTSSANILMSKFVCEGYAAPLPTSLHV